MFKEAAAIGSLDVQLIHYLGHHWEASPWVSNASTLADLMAKIQCDSGYTQIVKTLQHVRGENAAQKISALVFVGDAMEEEEADLYAAANDLKVPCFMFQEGDDPHVTKAFQEVALLTGGVHCRFDLGAADQLRDLLRAAAAYAAGGRQALVASRNAASIKLLQQLK
jgi:hypothetical protein